MTLITVILSICLLVTYGALFLRPKFRILAAALVSGSIFFLYLTMALALPQSEVISRISIIMLGVTGLGTIVLGILHVMFERGAAGTMTGARRPRGRNGDGGPPPREMAP